MKCINRFWILVLVVAVFTASSVAAETVCTVDGCREFVRLGESSQYNETAGEDALVGGTVGAVNIIRAPLKLVYSIVATGVGGLAWLFSAGDSYTFQSVAYRGWGGDYVIDEEQVFLRENSDFFGKGPAKKVVPVEVLHEVPNRGPLQVNGQNQYMTRDALVQYLREQERRN